MAENGNGRSALLKSAARILEGLAIGISTAAFIGTMTLTFAVRDELADVRREIQVTQVELRGLGALQAQQVQENARRIQDLLSRIERIEGRLFR